MFNIYSALRNNSGFGWDEGQGLITAPDYVWDEYLKVRFFIYNISFFYLLTPYYLISLIQLLGNFVQQSSHITMSYVNFLIRRLQLGSLHYLAQLLRKAF